MRFVLKIVFCTCVGTSVYFWSFGTFSPNFGMLYLEKSGNPGKNLSHFNVTVKRDRNVSSGFFGGAWNRLICSVEYPHTVCPQDKVNIVVRLHSSDHRKLQRRKTSDRRPVISVESSQNVHRCPFPTYISFILCDQRFYCKPKTFQKSPNFEPEIG
jgi:hypothetical protein